MERDRSGFNGVIRFAGTLRDAEDLLNESDHLKLIVLHVGINDLKSISIEDTFSVYNRCVSKCLRIADRVILSLLAPSKDQTLGRKIIGLNNSILSNFQPSDKFTICYNDNFSVRGKITDTLFTQDGIHLSVGQGVGLWRVIGETVYLKNQKGRARDRIRIYLEIKEGMAVLDRGTSHPSMIIYPRLDQTEGDPTTGMDVADIDIIIKEMNKGCLIQKTRTWQLLLHLPSCFS